LAGDEVSRTLVVLSAQLGGRSNVENAGIMAADFIRNHIYTGTGFAPLSPATEAYRGAGRPLQDTAHLRDSITAETTGENTAVVGTTTAYARIQNNGGVIKAKKNWLCIPAAGTRQLERRYGKAPKNVLDGLRSEGYPVFRAGRTLCYRKSARAHAHIVYYLKKSVTIPKREFWYLTDSEVQSIMSGITPEV
jgi:phage gpG-like protein